MCLPNKHHVFAESLKYIHVVGQLYTLPKKPLFSHSFSCLSCLLNFTGAAQSDKEDEWMIQNNRYLESVAWLGLQVEEIERPGMIIKNSV